MQENFEYDLINDLWLDKWKPFKSALMFDFMLLADKR